MKSLLLIFLSLALVFAFALPAFAHSGGTDSKGGHYNHKTGKYHYHHGRSAHQHYNGRCFYDILKYLLITVALSVLLVYPLIYVFLSTRTENDKLSMIIAAAIPLGVLIYEIYYFFF